jgi:hypothetical protein
MNLAPYILGCIYVEQHYCAKIFALAKIPRKHKQTKEPKIYIRKMKMKWKLKRIRGS